MDRILVYPGSIPLDTDVLNTNRNTMVALGYLAQAVLGSSIVVDGLGCVPTIPGSLAVTVGPGSIIQLSIVDTLDYGSLPADTSDPLVKLGINLTATSFTLTAPATSGQSINYLIQAALLESDTNPVVLPYYNAANPAQPYSGPNNSGVAQNTCRVQRVQLQLKAGAPANAGSQTTPPVDSGWVGLYVVTVSYGQTAIGAASIAQLIAAPFLPFKLPTLRPGFASAVQTYPSSGTFTVPAGVSQVEVEIWGGGSGTYASVRQYTQRWRLWRRLCAQARHPSCGGSDNSGDRRRWRRCREYQRSGTLGRRNVQLRYLCQRDGWQPEPIGQRGKSPEWRHARRQWLCG